MADNATRALFKLAKKTADINGEDYDPDFTGFVAKVKIRPISIGFTIDLQGKLDDSDTDIQKEGIRILGDKILESWNLIDDNGNAVPATGESLLEQDVALMSMITEGWGKALDSVSKRGVD